MTQGDPKKIQEALREFYDHYEGPGKVSDADLEGLAERYAGKEADLWKELYGHYEPSGIGEEVVVDLTTRYTNPYSKKKGQSEQPSVGGGVPSSIGTTGSPKDTENVLGLSYGAQKPSPVAQVSPVKPKMPPVAQGPKPKDPASIMLTGEPVEAGLPGEPPTAKVANIASAPPVAKSTKEQKEQQIVNANSGKRVNFTEQDILGVFEYTSQQKAGKPFAELTEGEMIDVQAEVLNQAQASGYMSEAEYLKLNEGADFDLDKGLHMLNQFALGGTGVMTSAVKGGAIGLTDITFEEVAKTYKEKYKKELTKEQFDAATTSAPANAPALGVMTGAGPSVYRDMPDVKSAIEITKGKKAKEGGAYQWAEGVDKDLAKLLKTNPQYAHSFLLSKLPAGIASAGGFVAASAVGGLAGAPAWLAPGILGMFVNGASQFEDALNRSGGDYEKAMKAFREGLAPGALEGAAYTEWAGKLFGKLGKGIQTPVLKTIMKGLERGTPEAIQESVTSILNNASAQRIYDATREILNEEVWESGAIGMITGIMLNGLAEKLKNAPAAERPIIMRTQNMIREMGFQKMQERLERLYQKSGEGDLTFNEQVEMANLRKALKDFDASIRDKKDPEEPPAPPAPGVTTEEAVTEEVVEQPLAPGTEAQGAEQEGQGQVTTEETITTEEQPVPPAEQPTEQPTEQLAPPTQEQVTSEETITPAEPISQPITPEGLTTTGERITADTPLEEIELTDADLSEMVDSGEMTIGEAEYIREAIETGDETMAPVIDGAKERKRRKYAVQEQTADESVLREERPEVGLQGVEQGNAEQEGVTQEGVVPEGKEEVTQTEENDIERRRNEELSASTQTLNIEDVRRPDGSIGTQGFDSGQMKDLVAFISFRLGLNIPNELLDKSANALKPLIDYINSNEQAKAKIIEYINSNPPQVSFLPDGTVQFLDGNHRANLLNLIGSDVIPVIEQRKAREINERYDGQLVKPQEGVVPEGKEEVTQVAEVAPEVPVTPKPKLTSKKPTLKKKKDGKDSGQDKGVAELPAVRPEAGGVEGGVVEGEAVRGAEAPVKPKAKPVTPAPKKKAKKAKLPKVVYRVGDVKGEMAHFATSTDNAIVDANKGGQISEYELPEETSVADVTDSDVVNDIRNEALASAKTEAERKSIQSWNGENTNERSNEENKPLIEAAKRIGYDGWLYPDITDESGIPTSLNLWDAGKATRVTSLDEARRAVWRYNGLGKRDRKGAVGNTLLGKAREYANRNGFRLVFDKYGKVKIVGVSNENVVPFSERRKKTAQERQDEKDMKKERKTLLKTLHQIGSVRAMVLYHFLSRTPFNRTSFFNAAGIEKNTDEARAYTGIKFNDTAPPLDLYVKEVLAEEGVRVVDEIDAVNEVVEVLLSTGGSNVTALEMARELVGETEAEWNDYARGYYESLSENELDELEANPDVKEQVDAFLADMDETVGDVEGADAEWLYEDIEDLKEHHKNYIEYENSEQFQKDIEESGLGEPKSKGADELPAVKEERSLAEEIEDAKTPRKPTVKEFEQKKSELEKDIRGIERRMANAKKAGIPLPKSVNEELEDKRKEYQKHLENEGKYRDAANQQTSIFDDEQTIADIIRKAKIDTKGKAFDATIGLPVAVWNGAVEVVAKAIEGGVALADAVQRGLNYIQKNHRGPWNKKEYNTRVIEELGLRGINVNGEDIIVKPVEDKVMAKVVDGLYSPLEDAIATAKKESATGKEWKRILDGATEAEEWKWTGLREYLEDGKTYSKADLTKFMEENRVQVVEKVLGGVRPVTEDDIDTFLSEEAGEGYSREEAREFLEQEAQQWGAEAGGTKFHQYQLPGEKSDYKEVLVLLPRKETHNLEQLSDSQLDDIYERSVGYRPIEEEGETRDEVIKLIREGRTEGGFQDIKGEFSFVSSHFDEPNILVHLRMNTRTGANGERVLFLEEVQSDWGQKGKKEGFRLSDSEVEIEFEKQGYVTQKEGKSHTAIYDKSGNRLGDVRNEDLLDAKRTTLFRERSNWAGTYKETPSAPFVMDTNAWVKLGLKFALKEAVAQGADVVAWTTGGQQFDRWGSEEIHWELDNVEGGEKTFSVNINEQTNNAQAFAGNEEAMRENRNMELDVLVSSKEELRKAIEKNLSRERNEGELNKLTDRIWERMQKEDSGTSMPRKEGMEKFYGDPKSKGMVGNVAEALVKDLTGEKGKVWKVGIELGEGTRIDAEVYDGSQDIEELAFNEGIQEGDWLITNNGEIVWYVPGGQTKEDAIIEFKETTAEAESPWIESEGGMSAQPSIPITPELKASVKQGMPLFGSKSERLRKAIAQAKSELKDILRDQINSGNLSSGLNPSDLLRVATKSMEIGMLMIQKGAADLKSYTEAMIKEFPEFREWIEANAKNMWENFPVVKRLDPQRRPLAQIAEEAMNPMPEGRERDGGEPKESKLFKNLDRTAFPESVKRQIRAEGGDYIPRSLEMTQQDADILIDELGEQWAKRQVMSDDSQVLGATRTALLSRLIDMANERIAEAEKAGRWAEVRNAGIAQADLFARAKEIGKRAGQEVNSFKLLYKIPADRIVLVATAERRQAQKDAVAQNQQAYDATYDEAMRIAQESADKAVNEVTSRFEKMLAERDAEIERLRKSGKEKSPRKQKAEKVVAKIQSWIDALDKSNPDGAAYDATSLLALGAKAVVKAGLQATQQAIRIGVSVADAIEAGVKAMRKTGETFDEAGFRGAMEEMLKDYDPASDKDVRKGMRDLVEAPVEGETTEDKKKRIAKATKKIRDAVKKAYGPDADGRTLTEVLIDDLGMDGDLAQVFATQIEKQFAKEVAKAKEQMEKAKYAAMGVKFGALDKMLDRMAEVDSGGMSESEAMTIFAEDLGVAGFTPRQQALIRALSASIKTAYDNLNAAQKAMANPNTASNRRQFNQAMAQYNAARRQVMQLTQQLANVVADRPGWGDMVKSILQGTLLRPSSQLINVFGNTLQQAAVRMPMQLISSAFAYTMHRIAKLPRMGSIQAGNEGYWMGAKPGLVEAASNAWKGTSDNAFVTGEAQPSMQPFEVWKRAFEGYDKEDWNSLSDLNNRAKDWVEMTYGLPADVMFRFLQLGDTPVMRAAEMAEAMRIADEKGLYKTPKQVQKMTPAQRAQHFADLGAFLTDPDPKSQKRITEAGQRATFKRGDFTGFVGAMKEAFSRTMFGDKLSKNPVALFLKQVMTAAFAPVMPYTNIPLNMFEASIKLYLPLIPATKGIYHALEYRRTKDVADLQRAYNEAAMATLGYFVVRPLIDMFKQFIAPSSDDDDERDERKAAYESQPPGTFNWSAYMRHLQGGDPYYKPDDIVFSTQKLGVWGNVMQFDADYNQDISREPNDGGFIVEELGRSMGTFKSFSQNTFQKNINSFVVGMQEGDVGRNFMTEYISTLMTITVPGGNTTSQIFLSKRKDKVSKSALKQMPWSERIGALWREKFQPNPDDLPKIIGIDGKPVAQNESDNYAVNLLNNMFDFLGIKRVTDDPYAYKLVKFFKDSGNNKDVLPPSIQRADLNKETGRRELKYTVNGEEATIQITPKMHESLERAVMGAGWNLWMALSDSDNWENMNDEQRVEALKKIWTDGRKAGEKVWRTEMGIPVKTESTPSRNKRKTRDTRSKRRTR